MNEKERGKKCPYLPSVQVLSHLPLIHACFEGHSVSLVQPTPKHNKYFKSQESRREENNRGGKYTDTSSLNI